MSQRDTLLSTHSSVNAVLQRLLELAPNAPVEVDEDLPWATRSTPYERKIARCGVPSLHLDTLRITEDAQRPRLQPPPHAARMASAVQAFVRAKQRGVLVLSGSNGVGKSVSGAWAAWATDGRFLQRAQWSVMRLWGDDAYQVEQLARVPGVVVLDEVCARMGSDPRPAIDFVHALAHRRHEACLGTILTTTAPQDVFAEAYGSDLADRAFQHQKSGGSGWVEHRGQSLRRAR